MLSDDNSAEVKSEVKSESSYSIISENEYNSTLHKDSEGQILPYKVAKGIQYPAIVLKSDKISGYLAKLVKSAMTSASEDDIMYNIYIVSCGKTMKIGQSTSVLLRILLDSDIFNEWKVCAYLNENKVIEGDLLYALC